MLAEVDDVDTAQALGDVPANETGAHKRGKPFGHRLGARTLAGMHVRKEHRGYLAWAIL